MQEIDEDISLGALEHFDADQRLERRKCQSKSQVVHNFIVLLKVRIKFKRSFIFNNSSFYVTFFAKATPLLL